MVASSALRVLRVCAVLLLALALFIGLPSAHPARAATLTVNDTTDAVDANPGDGVCETGTGNGQCTLRAAIMETNALAGPDTITLPAGTYTLTIPGTDEWSAATGDLNITDALAINGAGATTTVIDGGGLDRVFLIAQNATAELSEVTIRGGNAPNNGGGVLNLGALTITDSVIRDNNAPTSFGGGVVSGTATGRLALDRSAVTGNSGKTGGGLFLSDAGSTATITNSTISGNTATNTSGGIHSQSGANVTLTNVTISGNTSPAPAALAVGADVTLINVTIAGNTSTGQFKGAVSDYVPGKLSLKNTIIEDDSRSCYGDGIFQSLGHNLSSDDRCQVTGPGDMPNTDPKLGPLADNGGPTPTQALLVGSPAIDAGSSDCPPPATDQRGFSRPQGPVCDIGAFESQPGTSRIWGDGDCNSAVAPRDGQAILNHFLGKAELSQTPPCPAIGDPVTVAGASHTWGDFDCNGAVAPRDGQAILNHFLGKAELSQTPPCPAIGDTVQVVG